MNGIRLGNIGDVPFYVSPWYALLAVYTAMGTGSVARGGLWILCLTLSLVVHEMGHATVARHYRLSPRVLLHGFGGLCMHERAERDLHDVWIVAAGPAAGLLLGALALAVRAVLHAVDAPALTIPIVRDGLRWLIWLNVIWSLVNLVPLWPLDGGQLFRLGALRFARPLVAERITHGLGVALAITLGALAWVFQYGTLALVVVAAIGWMNVQAFRGERSSGPLRSQGRAARELATLARAALERSDWSEAARLAHMARDESRVPARVLDDLWRTLGLATARLGKHAEAVSYLRRAPIDPEVGEAWLRALLALGDDAEIRELLQGEEWRRLGATGQAIVDRLHSGV